MNATWRMLVTEFTLARRDVGNLAFGLVFPAVLLLVLGLFPGFTEADPDLGGRRLIDIYTPIVLILTFALVGIGSLAASLATYRTQGVLRRLRVTPVGPSRLLGAQFVAHLLVALLGSGLALIAARLAFDLSWPANLPAFVLGLTLAAASLFALGLVVGSVAASPSTASAVGPFVWLPLMVLGGLWFPREAMPELMRTISDHSPAGAAVDAVQEAWFGGTTQVTSLVVLAVSTCLFGLLAAATFRWE